MCGDCAGTFARETMRNGMTEFKGKVFASGCVRVCVWTDMENGSDTDLCMNGQCFILLTGSQ